MSSNRKSLEPRRLRVLIRGTQPTTTTTTRPLLGMWPAGGYESRDQYDDDDDDVMTLTRRAFHHFCNCCRRC